MRQAFSQGYMVYLRLQCKLPHIYLASYKQRQILLLATCMVVILGCYVGIIHFNIVLRLISLSA